MHGGLRYLEHYEFKLVHESLTERAIMLRTAPHIVRPLEFRLPHAPSMRPWPIVRIGLWLYDLLAWGGGLPRSRAVRIDDPGIKAGAGRGFSYWDGQVDDSRLVVLNALDAQACGAEIATRTRFLSASADNGAWQVRLDQRGAARSVAAKTIVNAAGPWVDRVLRDNLGSRPTATSALCAAAISSCGGAWRATTPGCSSSPTAALCSPFPGSTISP